jgi:hypothetical protein
MQTDRPCFFMICTNNTERECLERQLFGDKEKALSYISRIKKGHIGFLYNVTSDNLIGVFAAVGEPRLNIVPEAWRGKFPAQIRIQLIGELQRITGAVEKLKDIVTFRSIEKESSSFFMPAKRIYDADVTEKVLSLFPITPSEMENLDKLFGPEKITFSWRDYIGKYFLEIESNDLSYEGYEDRIAVLLFSLGFIVTQKGHKIMGEYADGIAAFTDDHAIVYDCKNMQDFFMTATEERAIKKYLEDEKNTRNEKHLFGAFIAKGFRGIPKKEILYISTETLLYLLYKKLILGAKFNLLPFKKICTNSILLSREIIDKEWLG